MLATADRLAQDVRPARASFPSQFGTKTFPQMEVPVLPTRSSCLVCDARARLQKVRAVSCGGAKLEENGTRRYVLARGTRREKARS